MKLDTTKHILIVGMGLLGGSYAKALTKKGFYVSAITRSKSSIDYALSEGMIQRGTTEIDPDIIADADLVVFALYPHIFIEWINFSFLCVDRQSNIFVPRFQFKSSPARNFLQELSVGIYIGAIGVKI